MWYLLACFLSGNTLVPVLVLNPEPYTTSSECEYMKDHPSIRRDYGNMIEGKEIVFVCAKLQKENL